MTKPYMQFYPADYLADTMHLTVEEHGAYLKLLFCMWQAGGWLVDDDIKIARILLLTTSRWRKIKVTLEPFFVYENGKFSQKKLQKTLDFSLKKSEKNSRNGRKGGQAKSLKNNNSTVANATNSLEQKASIARSPSDPEPYTKDSLRSSLAPLPPKDLKTKNTNLSRLPYADLPPEWEQWAHADMGWKADITAEVWAIFRDYWQAKTGKSAQKSEWFAAWRNWCRKERIPNSGVKNNAPYQQFNGKHHQPTKDERARAAIMRAAISGGFAPGQEPGS